MGDLDLDNPAWHFCVSLYGMPGVAAECLRSQDEFGLDVSLLLFCVWLGCDRGVSLDEAGFGEAKAFAGPWNGLVVQRLRAVRRDIKLSAEAVRPAVADFRSAVQRLEIEAERVQIALLFDWAAKLRTAPAAKAREAAALHNLELALRSYGESGDDSGHLNDAIKVLAAAENRRPRHRRRATGTGHKS